VSAPAREAVAALLNEVLPGGLPADWPEGRPLVEAGLDSVAVLTLVGELEARLGLRLGRQNVVWDAALRRGLSRYDGRWGFAAGLTWTARERRP